MMLIPLKGFFKIKILHIDMNRSSFINIVFGPSFVFRIFYNAFEIIRITVEDFGIIDIASIPGTFFPPPDYIIPMITRCWSLDVIFHLFPFQPGFKAPGLPVGVKVTFNDLPLQIYLFRFPSVKIKKFRFSLRILFYFYIAFIILMRK